MKKFTALTIPGTETFVRQELTRKLGEKISNIEIKSGEINIDGDIEMIQEFRIIQSATGVMAANNHSLRIDTSARPWRVALMHSGGINPSLAYVLCQAANLVPNDIMYDPFCGSGVIPITASTEFRCRKVIASDVSGSAIDMSQQNFNAAQIKKKKYVLFRSNISQVKLSENSIDKVVSNLPFGVRVGRHEDNLTIYSQFAQKLKSFMKPTGMAVLLTTDRNSIYNYFEDNFSIKEILQITKDGVAPIIFELKHKSN